MDEAAIVKKICARNGSMRLDDLTAEFSAFGVAVESLIDRSESCTVAFLHGHKTAIVRTSVRLCRAQTCPGCANLHLCKWFLFGSCKFDRGRRGCRFSHNLLSDQNAPVLAAHGLDTLDVKELCVLLLQSDPSLLPAVCYSYNNGTGEYGRCQQDCKRLHICQKYLRGSCDCPRAHDFYEPHPLQTLQGRGIPSELMASMKELYSHIEVLKRLSKNNPSAPNKSEKGQRRPSSTANIAREFVNTPQELPRTREGLEKLAEKTEICMFYIKGHCKHGGSCWKEHSSVPYKWEVKEGSQWKALPNNEALEKDFCDPAKTYSSGIEPVCFDMMTRGSLGVRRLSTVPSVLQPNFILTTEWLWFWEDEYGNWTQYGTAEGGHGFSSISSAELEQKYQADNGAVVEFTAGSQTYQLSCQDMIQENKRYTTKRVVRRRPKFVSAADVQTIKTTKRTPSAFKSLPDHWDKALTPETGYKTVPLQSTTGEYIRIKGLFERTMRGFSILKIDRVQNKALWEVFQWQKDCMRKKNGGRDVSERQLFHGTDHKYLDAICLNNLDWRICGTHGTAYGKGSYFARDAKYSHSYTKDSATRSMFVCRILVGDYTKGDSSYLRPPSKDGGDTIFYDSCVNDVFDPSIYVIFEKHQIYPEYLIEYRDAGVYEAQRLAGLTRPATPARTHVAVPVYRYSGSNATPAYSSSSSHSFYTPSFSSSNTTHQPSFSTSSTNTIYRPSSSTSTLHRPSSSTSSAAPSQSNSRSSRSECIIC